MSDITGPAAPEARCLGCGDPVGEGGKTYADPDGAVIATLCPDCQWGDA